jgi:ABC-type nitrate/sulfonate/bicarbonate transport system substrate-binding protein
MSQTDRTPVPLSRRSMLKLMGAGAAGLGAIPLLSSCSTGGGGSTGLTTITVATDWIKNAEYAGMWVADAKGYYKDEGLALNVLAGGPNAPASTTLVSAGKADLGIVSGTPTVISETGAGQADFVLIGTTYQQSPNGLLSLAKHPVRTRANLPGLKILMQQGDKVYLDALYKINRLPVSDFTTIPAGYDPTGLVQGQGDAYTCFVTNQPIILEEQYHLVANKDYFAVTWSDLGWQSYADTFYCNRNVLQPKHKLLEKFMRATIRGWQDNIKDPAYGAHVTMDSYGAQYGLVYKECLRENQLQIPLMQNQLTASKGLFRISKDLLGGAMYEGMRAAGFSQLPKADTFVDETVLDAVYNGKATV